MESNKEDKSDNALTAKGQNDAITMEEFDAFCSGQTEILMAGMDTSVPPESRQGTAAPTLENTYRLEPCKKFRPVQVQTVIEMAFHEHLEDKVYERRAAKQWTMLLCDAIKEKVKLLDLPRFKIVSFVSIGQRDRQDVHIGSRCLWNKAFDGFACGTYTNRTLYAVGVVYAVYHE